jgi:glutathione S-transferase
MKLYFSPGACSLGPHIAFCEIGMTVELIRVNLNTMKTKENTDLILINPKNQVPILVLDDGQVLTEVAVILQYIAELAPQSQLIPTHGTLERYRLQEWLNFIAAEVHKSFPAFFYPARGFSIPAAKAHLEQRFNYLNTVLTSNKYLLGEVFTVADIYLFNVLNWTRPAKIELSPWPALLTFISRVSQRPAVQAAMSAEGLT